MTTMNTRQLTEIERQELPTLEVGSVAVSTWGYDQTNVDFYVVLDRKVRKDDSTWVKVQPVASAQTPSEHFMQYTARPFRSPVTGDLQTFGKPVWRKLNISDAFGESFSPESYSFARPWEGQDVGGSSYA